MNTNSYDTNKTHLSLRQSCNKWNDIHGNISRSRCEIAKRTKKKERMKKCVTAHAFDETEHHFSSTITIYNFEVSCRMERKEATFRVTWNWMGSFVLFTVVYNSIDVWTSVIEIDGNHKHRSPIRHSNGMDFLVCCRVYTVRFWQL